MLTFYIIGVVITFLFLLLFWVWLFMNERVDELDVIGSIPKTVFLSSLSWAVICIIGMIFLFEQVKKNKREQDEA